MSNQQTYSLEQIQKTCAKILIEDEPLFGDDEKFPPRAQVMTSLFLKMTFEHVQVIDRLLLTDEQINLIRTYS